MKDFKNNILKDIKNLYRCHGLWLIIFLTMLYTIAMSVHVYIKIFSCFIFLFFYFNKIKIDRVLILFSILYTIIAILTGALKSNFEGISYILSPITFYCFGRLVVCRSKQKEEIATFFLLLVVASCIMIWDINIQDAKVNGLVNVFREVDIDGRALSATGQGLIVSLGFIGLAYFISRRCYVNFKSILFLFVSLLSLFVVIHLINRTGIIVLAFTIIITMLYSSRDNYKTILFVVLSMTIIYYFLTMSGVINTDVFDSYEQRNLATNSSAESAGGRMGLWEQSLTNLINYPWGWSKYNDFYCHNMWLDIARCAGWIPFIIIVAFTFKHLVIIFKLFRIRNDWFIGFLIGINGCLILSSFVEPVLELSSTYFCIICLVWGVQQQYYCQIKRNLQNDYNYKLLGNYVKSDIYS